VEGIRPATVVARGHGKGWPKATGYPDWPDPPPPGGLFGFGAAEGLVDCGTGLTEDPPLRTAGVLEPAAPPLLTVGVLCLATPPLLTVGVLCRTAPPPLTVGVLCLTVPPVVTVGGLCLTTPPLPTVPEVGVVVPPPPPGFLTLTEGRVTGVLGGCVEFGGVDGDPVAPGRRSTTGPCAVPDP
jgi:hypothetical protein